MNRQAFDWEISSKRPLLMVNARDVWHYRDLLWLMVRRDFVSFYKQTVFGPLWFFLQPIATTIIYTFIFGDLARISTDGLPQPLFYMAGIILWNYFSDCLLKTSTVFKDNSGVFGKVYFPRLVVPLSIVISNLTRFAVQFVLFLLSMAFYAIFIRNKPFEPNAYLLLLPFLVTVMAALGLGAGMIISALTTKYRDLSFVVTFGISLLMYTTTVMYPLSETLTKYSWSWIMQYNPLTPLIEAMRMGFLGKGTFSWQLLGYSTGVSVALLLFGIVIFNKVEKDFIDTV